MMTLEEEWEKVLVKEGLGMKSGHVPDLMCYGYSVSEMDDLPAQNIISSPAFQLQVELKLREVNRDSTAAERMRNLLKSRRSAKQRLKEKIWSTK